MPHYEIRLFGEGAAGARVEGALLRDLLNALVEGVRRATRLRVEGRSSAPGMPPAWLEKASAFMVVGFREGSTVVELEAPVVDDAIVERTGLGPLFEIPDRQSTGIGWLRESLDDALAGDAASDRYDGGLLEAISGWGRVLDHGITRIEFRNGTGSVSQIDDAALERAAGLKRSTPPPRRVRIAGRLEQIRHSDRAFTLILEDGVRVRGLAADVPPEVMGTLWGKKTTLSALAHFRPTGSLLRLEADHLEAAGDDFTLWAREPAPLFADTDEARLRQPQGPRTGINAIIGAWPGDETDEEILRALEELS